MSFEETLLSANNRIKADIENCYNLTMQIKMSSEVSAQIELLRELEQKLYRITIYTEETIKKYQVD